jgi:tetratricopeptide (TPR) repeat protein
MMANAAPVPSALHAGIAVAPAGRGRGQGQRDGRPGQKGEQNVPMRVNSALALRAAALAAAILLGAPVPPAPASSPGADQGGQRQDRLESWVGASLSGSYLAGRHAARQRDYEHAARFFESTLAMDPANARLLHRAFVLYASTGQWAKADELARRILRVSPQQRLAHLVLGLKAVEEGDTARAREHFSKAARTPVGELTSALLTAWTYAAEKRLSQALEALKPLEKYDAFASFRDFHAALIADLLGSPTRAERLYARAWKEVSGSLRISQAYVNFLRRQGRIGEARKVCRKFLSSAPENAVMRATCEDLRKNPARRPAPLIRSAREGMAEALFSLASALTDDRSIDIALVYARMALRMRPDFPVAWMLLGEIFETMRKYDQAVKAYGHIPATHPLRVPAEIQIALALDDLKRTDEAIKRLRRLARAHPREYKVHLTLGNILRAHERWKEAAAAYSRALALMGAPQPRHWTVYYFRGIAHERSGRWKEAEADFRLALKLNPDHPSVLNYLGYSLIDRGEKLNEALEMVRKAVDARPNDGYIVDSLGWAYYRLGRYKEAVEQLERAVELRPDDPVINDHLGDAYWKVGRKLEARFQWQHALDAKPEPKDEKRIRLKLKLGLDAVERMEKAARKKAELSDGGEQTRTEPSAAADPPARD